MIIIRICIDSSSQRNIVKVGSFLIQQQARMIIHVSDYFTWFAGTHSDLQAASAETKKMDLGTTLMETLHQLIFTFLIFVCTSLNNCAFSQLPFPLLGTEQLI